MDLEPWYRGFKGTFEWNNESRDGYVVYGKINRIDHNTI